MKKTLLIVSFIFGLVVLVGVFAQFVSRSTDPVQGDTEGVFVPEELPFFVELPDGWTHEPEQGIDSLVGKFRSATSVITYDYGWYGGFGVSEEEADYTVESDTVDGGARMIGYPVSGVGDMALELRPKEGMSYVTLFAGHVDPQDQETILDIFRSVRLR